MTELLHSKGFLGTSANFAADLTLVIMLVVAAIFTTGLVLARLKKYEAHRWVQTTGATMNAIMIFWMMVLPYRDFVIRDAAAPQLATFYAITTFHATIGLIAMLFGLFVTLRGNEIMFESLKFKKYKGFMRAAYTFYMLATLAGVWVYVTWFVTNTNPPVYE